MKSLLKFSTAILLIAGLFLITGCGGSGDSGGSSTPTGTNNSATTKVTVYVEKPTPTGSIRSTDGINGKIFRATGVAMSGATSVTLTLNDGTKYTMTDDGNGNYSATVSNLDSASGLYVEAHKGDLIVKNMVTDLTDVKNGKPVSANALTTLFTEVAKAMATAQGIEVASTEDLIKQVKNVTIDFTSLYSEVTGTSTKYDSARQAITIAMTDADTKNTGTDIITQLTNGTLKPTVNTTAWSWTEQIATPIKDGTIATPVTLATTDKDVIKKAINDFFVIAIKGASITETEQSTLSTMIGDDAIFDGAKKTTMLNQLKAGTFFGNKESPTSIVISDITLEANGANSYKVYVKYIFSAKDAGGNAFTQTWDNYNLRGGLRDDPAPFIFTKYTDGTWKFQGDGLKCRNYEIEYKFEKSLDDNSSTYAMWLGVDGTTDYPVSTVIVSGPGLPTGGVSLVNNPQINDSNEWSIWQSLGTQKPTVGMEYTVTVTFKDGTTEVTKRSIQALPSSLDNFSGSVTIANGNVTVSWNQDVETYFNNYWIDIWNANSTGDSRILERDINDNASTSITFPTQSTSYTITPGTTLRVTISSSSRTGFVKQFHKNVTVQ